MVRLLATAALLLAPLVSARQEVHLDSAPSLSTPSLTLANEQQPSTHTLTLYHRFVSYSSAPSPFPLPAAADAWTRRGEFTVSLLSSDDNDTASYSPSPSAWDALQAPRTAAEWAGNEGKIAADLRYQLAVQREGERMDEVGWISVDPCKLFVDPAQQALTEQFTLHWTPRGRGDGHYTGLRYWTDSSAACEEGTSGREKWHFAPGGEVKTEVVVDRGIRIEPPRLEVPPAEDVPHVQLDAEGKVVPPPPPKSFIQKYWMYIVPVLLFIMLGGGAEEPQGSGGGGTKK
ncbi:hypothetical protein JCM1841_006810 [Sporobolomyces salmonicolor]